MEQKLPRHIAVTPDGSRRWAKSYGLTKIMGHSEGRKRFHEISKAAFELGVSYFTFWAMSEDNLNKRETAEIDYLISLMHESLQSRIADDLLKNQIRFRVLGRWRSINRYNCLTPLIDDLENRTRFFDKNNLTIWLGYDGTIESTSAVLEIIMKNWKPTSSNPQTMIAETAEKIMGSLWSRELPPVDLVIRTGETRENWFHNSSGFMMWHTANSEIRLSQTLWPDFSVEEFKQIVAEYGQRERKFGQ